MSWLARSIADSLRIENEDSDEDEDEDEDDENNTKQNPKQAQSNHRQNDDDEELLEEDRAGRGVRGDISEFTETLTRQLWGVASFLAPPPPPPPPPPSSRNRIDRDYSEHLDHSWNEVETEMWKRDSKFLPSEPEDEIGEAVGITEEVLAFAMNIAHHPETWLDFPLDEEDDADDFDMSNAQHEHVLVLQRVAPRLAALRIELCPAHMSDGYFWKVYFVLLHSRLHKHDAELLSTPQIVAARAMWMQELQKQTKIENECFRRGTSYAKESNTRWTNRWEESFDNPPCDDTCGNMSAQTFTFEPATYFMNTEFETEKHRVVGVIDKSVIEEEPLIKTRDVDFVAGPLKAPVQNYYEEDEDDDWLKEDSELNGYSGTVIVLGDDEDVSFSDLEEEEDCTMPLKSK